MQVGRVRREDLQLGPSSDSRQVRGQASVARRKPEALPRPETAAPAEARRGRSRGRGPGPGGGGLEPAVLALELGPRLTACDG